MIWILKLTPSTKREGVSYKIKEWFKWVKTKSMLQHKKAKNTRKL